jgi:serine/threonine protein kinase
VVCLDPIWVKISDFGVSKREKNSSSIRSQVGTYGYMAPELLGYFSKGKARYLAYALDMWSLGILLHEIATCKAPFCRRATDTEPESDLDPYSDSELSAGYVTFSTWVPVIRLLDDELLRKYCSGHAEFPVDLLETSNMCKDKEGISFLKALLVAAPKDRLTAACALKTPWLDGYNCQVDNLKKEFRLLGVDLDLSGGKEPQK